MADEQETVSHAASRVIRFIKIDETSGGGLLSIDTLKAVEMLRKTLMREERMKKGQ